LKNNSVTAAIRTDAVREAEIQAGAVQDAELGTIVSRKDTTAIPDGGSGRADVQCDAGERMIGGGGNVQQSSPDAIYHGDNPTNPVRTTAPADRRGRARARPRLRPTRRRSAAGAPW